MIFASLTSSLIHCRPRTSEARRRRSGAAAKGADGHPRTHLGRPRKRVSCSVGDFKSLHDPRWADTRSIASHASHVVNSATASLSCSASASTSAARSSGVLPRCATSGLGGLLGHDVAPSAVRCAASGACPVSPLGGPSVRPRGSAGKGGSKGSSAQRTRRAKMLCGPCLWRGAGRTLGRPRERAAGVDQQFLGPRGPERRASVAPSRRPAVLLGRWESSVPRVTLSCMEVTESLLAGVPVGQPPRAAGRVRRACGPRRSGSTARRPGAPIRTGSRLGSR